MREGSEFRLSEQWKLWMVWKLPRVIIPRLDHAD
jgi:hypothetical protein